MTVMKAGSVALAVAAAVAFTAGCEIPESIATEPATSPLADPVDVSAAAATLATLQVAPEDTGAHYDRDNWPHWSSTGDGCDTRDSVLIAHGEDVTVTGDCRITGTWVSSYDGMTVTDPSDLDIDHVVPLAEVARSGRIDAGRRVGPRYWNRDQREAYANDPAGLVAVTASSNRSKGDDDPASWLPDHDRCRYAARWIEIKTRYRLSADQAEHDALAAVLNTCDGGSTR